jgi:hypothetical protein
MTDPAAGTRGISARARPPLLIIVTLLLLLAAAVAAAWALLPRIAPKLVIQRSPWLNPILRAASRDERFLSQRLKSWPDRSAVLAVATRSRDVAVRRGALIGLGCSLDFAPEVVAALIDRSRDPVAELRMMAIRLLGQQRSPDATRCLLDCLAGTEADTIEALHALRVLEPGPLAGEVLRAVLVRGSDDLADVRDAALTALFFLHHPAVVALMVERVADTDDRCARLAVAYLVSTHDPRVIDLMEARLRDERDPATLARFIATAADTRDPRRVDLILGVVERSPGPVVRHAAAAALAKSAPDTDQLRRARELGVLAPAAPP